MAAVVSAIVMLITAAVVPIIAAMHAHGSGRGFYVLYRGFYIWATSLAVLAFVCGLIVGPKRMASLFGHLWGTEEPRNMRVSGALWLSVAAIVGISWWLS